MQRVLNRLVFTCVTLILFSVSAYATHNRAGEITYTHVEGLTYEVLITTYTKASAVADRPQLLMYWGDEIDQPVDTIERETINNIPGDIQINTYRGTHTYGGPGVFELMVIDPNRNEGVLNMIGSVDTPFAIRSLLIIDPEAGHNNSVKLLNPATENACIYKNWEHNPAAFDADGDVLVYSLVPCRGYNGEDIPTYEFPDAVSDADDVFQIDSSSGDVTWSTPQIVGEYNIAILIEEFREVNGVLKKVGEVVRDMQIDVQLCSNNPPQIENLADTCILAGTFLTWEISATDPDEDGITLSAAGGPISEVVNEATFTNLGGGQGEFAWDPQCPEVRYAPYQVVFKAKDLGNPVPLADLETILIRVVSPGVEDLASEPIGNTVLLSWNESECSDQGGRHEFYRRVNSAPWDPVQCETGVPEELGYELVAVQDDLENTSFVDDDLLSFGATYCYRVVMRFDDGGESLSSNETCATIIKDVPVMTHADIEITDEDGLVNVGWSPPTEMDTITFPLPYTYTLFRLDDSGGVDIELATGLTDSTYVDQGINTSISPFRYRVEAWCETAEGPQLVGGSIPASTPFLELDPNDNRITLTIVESKPWVNYRYLIERKTLDELDFTPYDTSYSAVYVDSGLVNTQEYCYRVTTEGEYDSDMVEWPLLNRAQTNCSTPYDFTPPCPPILEIDPDCEEMVDFLSWGGAHECADDVMGYILYWSPIEGGELEPYATLTEDSTYVFNEDNSMGTIAGCFAVTALDSLLEGPGGIMRQNESEFSNPVCADNCPYYFLPNVFSPNGDNVNEKFYSYPWKFIESVDFVVYNRWGIEVFRTENPDINWDGKSSTGEPLADGVYFYSLTAYTIRLEGIIPEKFTGSVTILR